MQMKTRLIFLLSFFLFVRDAYSQESGDTDLSWWNPVTAGFTVLEGQPWPGEAGHFYDRFPARARETVRKEVWSLSRNGAGLKLRFRTNSKQITIRYQVEKKKLAMDHFPATGVSGIDLYSRNRDGSWAWATGRYTFGDTIVYQFNHLDLNTEDYPDGREYHLYLPLYNNVAWLEIGVGKQTSFMALPARKEKPIVVYGTSIAQGGCASRPGMAWTAILERQLGVPMVNLGFSGNGRMEEEVVNLVAEIDARVFVLDCLPNLGGFEPPEVEKRILHAVRYLRKKHPDTPIVLAEHSGFVENRLNAVTRGTINRSNGILQKAHKTLIAEGVMQLYRLPAAEIDMGTDGTVDGSHPTDFGMYKYAVGYEKLLRQLPGVTE
jgi:hypothetical protein